MSIQAVAWVLEYSETTAAERLVLLAIANHCDARGWNAYPSIDHIVAEARVARSTVFKAINILVELGEVEVTRGGGRGHRNQYRLPMKRSEAATLFTVSNGDSVQDLDSKGSEMETKRVSGSDPGVRNGDLNGPQIGPEPSLTRKPSPPLPPLAGGAGDEKSRKSKSKPADPLAVRAARVVPGTSCAAAADLVERLEAEGIGRSVIDEAIGFALGRDDVRSLGYLQQIARDWMTQRDPTWSPQFAASQVRSIRETLQPALAQIPEPNLQEWDEF
jgi:hypothetical protein